MSDEYKEMKVGKTPISIYADKVYIGSNVIDRENLLEIVKLQDELQPPKIKIEFEWDTYEEDDDEWEALYVKIDDGRWLMTEVYFNCEDEGIIRTSINENPEHWKSVK